MNEELIARHLDADVRRRLWLLLTQAAINATPHSDGGWNDCGDVKQFVWLTDAGKEAAFRKAADQLVNLVIAQKRTSLA